MKRIAAPKIKYWGTEVKDPFNLKITREGLPPDWLLSELMLHIINLCFDAYEKVSARMLLDCVLSQNYAARIDSFFNDTYTISYRKGQVIYHEWVKSLTPEERAAWDPDTYFKKRDASIPQYQVMIDVGNFILGEYRHLPVVPRVTTDLAFQGFLLDTLNSPDFASLCKNTALLVPTMTFEQKLDEELDHEALHHRLMVQLGHA